MGRGARVVGGVLQAVPVSLGPTLLTTVFLWVLVLETPSCV